MIDVIAERSPLGGLERWLGDPEIDEVIVEGRATTVTIRSPRVPGSPHYRLLLRNGAVRAALESWLEVRRRGEAGDHKGVGVPAQRQRRRRSENGHGTRVFASVR